MFQVWGAWCSQVGASALQTTKCFCFSWCLCKDGSSKDFQEAFLLAWCWKVCFRWCLCHLCGDIHAFLGREGKVILLNEHISLRSGLLAMTACLHNWSLVCGSELSALVKIWGCFSPTALSQGYEEKSAFSLSLWGFFLESSVLDGEGKKNTGAVASWPLGSCGTCCLAAADVWLSCSGLEAIPTKLQNCALMDPLGSCLKTTFSAAWGS